MLTSTDHSRSSRSLIYIVLYNKIIFLGQIILCTVLKYTPMHIYMYIYNFKEGGNPRKPCLITEFIYIFLSLPLLPLN